MGTRKRVVWQMIFVNSSLFDQSLERNARGFLIMVSFSMLIANETHIMLLLSLSEYFFDESFFLWRGVLMLHPHHKISDSGGMSWWIGVFIAKLKVECIVRYWRPTDTLLGRLAKWLGLFILIITTWNYYYYYFIWFIFKCALHYC